MNRKTNNKAFIEWIEDIWEEIEIQFLGIIGSIFFFFLVYLFFQPPWMKPLINFFTI